MPRYNLFTDTHHLSALSTHRGTDHFSYSLANDRAAHLALHEAQRQPEPTDQADSGPSASHSPPADPHPCPQQQDDNTAEQLHPSQPPQHSSHQRTPQPGKSPPAESVTLPQRLETQDAEAAHSPQQEGTVQPQQAASGTPTATCLPGSMTKQDPQQQLLQQLAAQAGFQLVSPPSQSAGPAAQAGGMHQAEQGTPVQASLPHQQQQWPAAHAGVSQGLSLELSHHGLLQQLGQDLQSSAMQIASMQQQQQVQQQSRLPAWAQQALLPDHTPPATPPASYYGMLGVNPPHSMHALHSSPAHGLPGHYLSAAHTHEQFGSGGLRASQTGASWGLPAWHQQQQPQQPQPQWELHDQHTQQFSDMTPLGNLDNSAMQGSGAYSSSLLDPRSSPGTAFWPLGHGGVDISTPATPQGWQASPMRGGQSQAGTAAPLHSHSGGPQQQGSRGGSLPGARHDEHLEIAMAVNQPSLSVLDPNQGEVGVPSVLSRGSSGVSSPLRESGHLESLVEVNSRVEAAMGRARAQLQVSLNWFVGSTFQANLRL